VVKKEYYLELPIQYKTCVDKSIFLARKVYKDNLVSIFLAGSTAKGNCIEGWSDIDLYIITNKLDLDANKEFYEKSKKYEIHIGTTFYTLGMINNLEIDSKTFAAFYEYHAFDINKIIYGNFKVPNITYKKLLSVESDINNLVQAVERELFNYMIDKKNFKTLVKKTVVLMKVYLNKYYNKYSYGYHTVSIDYKNYIDSSFNYDIEEIIKTNDKDNDIVNMVKTIINCVVERNNNMKRISARGLIKTKKGLAVIFRRKISEKGTKEYYVTPGGGINEGENIEEGLRRELREELNIEVNINKLAFKVETDERIEYFYDCEYISGDFTLKGEELDRMSESNYYEPTFIKIKDLDKCDIMQEVKDYYKK